MTEKTKKYTDYSESNIEWIGQIPSSWNISKLKWQFKIINGGTPKSSEKKYWDDIEGYVWITPEDLKGKGNFISDSERKISFEGLKNSSANLIKSNSIVISTRAPIGKVKISTVDYTTNQGCKSLEQERPLDIRYFYYLILSSEKFLQSLGRGTTFIELSNYSLRNLSVPIPNVESQQKIADFLDRKTSEIDDLIADKERLIDLLEEKRTSIITNAVTQGVRNSKKTIKTNIGYINSNWKLLPLKRLVSTKVTDGPHETPQLVDEGIPLISAESIKDGEVNFQYKRGYITEEEHIRYSKKCKPTKGDIFLIKSGATTGRVAMVNTEEEFNIWSPLALIRADENKVLSKYLYYYLSSKVFYNQVETNWHYGTQQNIGMGVIERLLVSLPSLSEQEEIIEFIEEKIIKIDQSIKQIGKQVELLNEYRQSIIFEAVTGKIDVREYPLERKEEKNVY